MSDFESAMYDLLIAALTLRAAALYDGGEIPEFLLPITEALDAVELAAPASLFPAAEQIRVAVDRVLGATE